MKEEKLFLSLSFPFLLSLPPRSTLSSRRLKNPTRASLTVLLSDTTTSIEPRREGTRRVFSFPLLLLPPLFPSSTFFVTLWLLNADSPGSVTRKRSPTTTTEERLAELFADISLGI